ncbi:hypothetical protein BRPE64_ACDS06350 [Caballeronia insecticola]|uniref:Uncharacterized protein n=1 Tax=Caballeronia insecticola TaxID=758793 RepID=R4WFQ6_9BURK|nr:hypothetical protein BRPE64_ACDS06350 [Caballeronia insecticola]
MRYGTRISWQTGRAFRLPSRRAPVTAAEKIADNCGFHPSAKILSEDKRDGL